MVSETELTAVVFTYNRRAIVETTLRSARFADRLVVFDKGSTDGTAEVGRAYADDFFTIPWTPTVEATKAEYVPRLTSDWLLLLDDDECLNTKAIDYISTAVASSGVDVHYLPFRHYVLGTHDERAYYWPQYRPALFRCGTIEFGPTVHGGTRLLSDSYVYVAPETGASILHLSHPDVASWIEKTNRYTDQRQRASAESKPLTPAGIIAVMETWLSQVPVNGNEYLTAVAALRGIYDVVDAIKRWEDEIKNEGAFEKICNRLQADYDAYGIPRCAQFARA